MKTSSRKTGFAAALLPMAASALAGRPRQPGSRGVSRDYATAARNYRIAARLGTLYRGVKRSPLEAYRLCRRAAEAGHPAARQNLGQEMIPANSRVRGAWPHQNANQPTPERNTNDDPKNRA